jgi:hypothetical protein
MASALPIQAHTTWPGYCSANSVWRVARRLWKSLGQGVSPARLMIRVNWLRRLVLLSRLRKSSLLMNRCRAGVVCRAVLHVAKRGFGNHVSPYGCVEKLFGPFDSSPNGSQGILPLQVDDPLNSISWANVPHLFRRGEVSQKALLGDAQVGSGAGLHIRLAADKPFHELAQASRVLSSRAKSKPIQLGMQLIIQFGLPMDFSLRNGRLSLGCG